MIKKITARQDKDAPLVFLMMMMTKKDFPSHLSANNRNEKIQTVPASRRAQQENCSLPSIKQCSTSFHSGA